MNTQQRWGLFSPQAEAHLQSVMGLQALSSSRALDFLEGLPDVDPKRLAMTGASGGGTQTFILSALDPRIAVSVPAVMVSTAMQGGCTCENACLLRIGTGNVEFAAQFAPKPLCLTAANDWTKEMETKGFPELKEHFKVMGAISHVELNAFTWFGHNYNYVSRSAMYQWMNKYLRLGLKSPVVEQAYPRLTAAELTVWDDQHPKPKGSDEFERKLLEGWHQDAQRQLDALLPQDASSLAEFQRIVSGAVDVVVGEGMPAADQVEFTVDRTTEHEGFSIAAGRTRNKHLGSELPTLLVGQDTDPSAVTVWLDGKGKSGLFTADGKLRPAVQRLLDNGIAVLGVDLLYQGEFLKDGTPLEETPKVENPREAACYTFGYNNAVFAQRVHDVLTMVALAKKTAGESAPVYLVGLNGAGPWASAALSAARSAVAKAAIDTGGFRFGDVKDIHSPDFLPGGAKYFDLPGMIALGAPTALWLAGEGETRPAVIDVVYRSAKGATPVMDAGTAEGRDGRAVDWLIE